MTKEHERRERLKTMNEEDRKKEEQHYEEMKKKHANHPKVNHPVSHPLWTWIFNSTCNMKYEESICYQWTISAVKVNLLCNMFDSAKRCLYPEQTHRTKVQIQFLSYEGDNSSQMVELFAVPTGYCTSKYLRHSPHKLDIWGNKYIFMHLASQSHENSVWKH